MQTESHPDVSSHLRIQDIVTGILLILLVIQALFFVVHAVQVIRFPHDVDNEEGFLLWQSLEILAGRSPYQPLAEAPHVVGNYPPLYLLVCALGNQLIAPTLAIGRTLSFISALGIGLLLAGMVYRQSQQWSAAAIAALLFLGTYHVYSWGVFHRVDMLALFFSTLALYLCIAQVHWGWIVLASTLALFSKQTAFAAPVAIGCYWLSQHRRRSTILFWSSLVLAVGGISLLLNHLTSGEYFRHTILYNKNEFIWMTIFIYARHLWQFYAILCAFALFYFVRGAQLKRLDLLFWFLIFSVLSASLCGKIGSAPNYLLELMLALSWAAALIKAEIRTSEFATRQWLGLFIPILLILQVLESFHLPHLPPVITTSRYDFAWTPTSEDHDREEVLAYHIRRTQGEVLLEDAGIAIRLGRPVVYQPFICTQLENQRLWDPTPVIQRLEKKEFDLLVLRVNMDEATAASDRFSESMIRTIKKNYYLDEVVPGARWFYLHRPRVTATDENATAPGSPR